MKLNERQKRHLRGLGHKLRPCVMVGNAGVTGPLLRELDQALDHHELLKIQVRTGDRDSRDAAIELIVDGSRANLVSRVGNIALLYRRSATNARIVLPDGGAAA